MGRKATRIAHNYCKECGTEMSDVTYVRPFAKLCKECRNICWSANAEVKKITTELRKRNSMMTKQELGEDEMFVDDPRAVNEIEIGRVYKQPTVLHKYASPIGRNYDV